MIIARLIAAIIIFYLLYRMARWLFLSSEKASKPLPNQQMPSITEDLVEDPCCHTFLPLSQAYKVVIDGKAVHFCSEACYENFRKNRS
jgi:YHS domain-containing protein